MHQATFYQNVDVNLCTHPDLLEHSARMSTLALISQHKHAQQARHLERALKRVGAAFVRKLALWAAP